MKRYQIIVQGRVQGVGFRTFVSTHAVQLNLTGSVRNMSNGMVEIFVQGETDDLTKLLGFIVQGNRWIHVDDYTIKELPVVTGEKKFSCDYYSSSY